MLAFFHNLHKRLCIIILPSTSKLNSVNLYLPLTQFNYAGRLVSQYHKFGQSFSWESQIAFVFCLLSWILCPSWKIVQFFFGNFKSRASQVEHKQTKALLRKAKYKLMEGEAGMVDFDWTIGLCCFILKLCVKL